MKKEHYHSILQRHAIPSGINLIGRGFIFQQDNDPKHTSKLCTSYLEGKKVAGDLNIMEWPPQSPDLNPIELLWEELDRRVRDLKPTSLPGLWDCSNEAWNNIPPHKFQKLIERMPKLCAAVMIYWADKKFLFLNKGILLGQQNIFVTSTEQFC